MMNSLVNKENLNIGLLLLLVFSLPLYQKMAPVFIVSFAISTIYVFFKTKAKIQFTKSNVGLMLFYFVLAFGLFWTNNMKAGVFDLEVKMSLFIFPLLFSMTNYKKSIIIKVVRALTLGVLIFFIVALYFAFQNYFLQPNGYHYFLYSRLSAIIHPSYMSMYIVTAIALTLNLFQKGIYIFFSKIMTAVVVGILFLINFMVLSKIGIVLSLLVCVYYLYLWIRSTKKYIVGVGVFLVVTLLFTISYHKVNYVAQRVDEFTSIFNSEKKNIEGNSSGVRLYIWEQAIVLIKEKPLFGYGTGDVKDVLVERYKINKLTSAVEHKYNAHNQFFQILISSGLLGLVLFLGAVIFGIKMNSLFSNFIIILLTYMLVESTLENQAGTIFFGLFFGLLSQKSFAIFDGKAID